MKTSVFVGVSVDGFIAGADGALDFLDAGGDEPHGYEEFIATVDTIVMGRKTFETVLGFGSWPFGEKPVVVLSSQSLDLSTAASRGGRVEQDGGGPPAHVVAALSDRGAQHLYLDGGITIQGFLRAGLVTRLIVAVSRCLSGTEFPSSAPSWRTSPFVTLRRRPFAVVWCRPSMNAA